MVIETVGSCCTLVAEKVTKDSRFIMDATVAELLYGKCGTSVVLDPFMPVAAKTTNYFVVTLRDPQESIVCYFYNFSK